jgi:hypothetical protein
MLKEELTTKMHSEFTVSKETDVKHRVYALLTLTGINDKDKIKKYASTYRVTPAQIKRYLPRFKSLST